MNQKELLNTVIGEENQKLVTNSRCLVVGAGGIGCELLKNLVMSGFSDLVVVDLDTIDVSNLNRQFLFRNEHVGMSKSQVARESVLKYRPDVKIESFQTKIQDPMFNHDYMKQFDLVFSALDNDQARTYLNRLCYSANVPIIESGTHGYIGQSYPILHGITECKECNPTEKPKTFAVCTIRNTPDQPIHCIAWAKSIYDALFGPQDTSNEMATLKLDQHYSEIMVLAQKSHDAPTSETLDDSTNTNTDTDSNTNTPVSYISEELKGEMDRETELVRGKDDVDQLYAYKAFMRFFTTEMYAQRSVAGRWKTTAPPDVLFASKMLEKFQNETNVELTEQNDTNSIVIPPRSQRMVAIQPIETYAKVFIDTVTQIHRERSSSFGNYTFTKDDPLSVDFVTSAALLRMHAYHISLITEFQAQGDAGNIVHAVSTTNAISAGLMTLTAIQVLENIHKMYSDSNNTSVSQKPGNFLKMNQEKMDIAENMKLAYIYKEYPRMVFASDYVKFRNHCFCDFARYDVYADLDEFTLQNLFDIFNNEDVEDSENVGDSESEKPVERYVHLNVLLTGKMFGCLDDGSDERNDTPLATLGINNGDAFVVFEENSECRCMVRIFHRKSGKTENSDNSVVEVTEEDINNSKRFIGTPLYTYNGEITVDKHDNYTFIGNLNWFDSEIREKLRKNAEKLQKEAELAEKALNTASSSTQADSENIMDDTDDLGIVEDDGTMVL